MSAALGPPQQAGRPPAAEGGSWGQGPPSGSWPPCTAPQNPDLDAGQPAWPLAAPPARPLSQRRPPKTGALPKLQGLPPHGAPGPLRARRHRRGVHRRCDGGGAVCRPHRGGARARGPRRGGGAADRPPPRPARRARGCAALLLLPPCCWACRVHSCGRSAAVAGWPGSGCAAASAGWWAVLAIALEAGQLQSSQPGRSTPACASTATASQPPLQRSWTTTSGGRGGAGAWRRRRRGSTTRSWCAAELTGCAALGLGRRCCCSVLRGWLGGRGGEPAAPCRRIPLLVHSQDQPASLDQPAGGATSPRPTAPRPLLTPPPCRPAALACLALRCCALQGEVEINLDEARGPIREWIAQEPVRREIGRRFARLLKSFADEHGDLVYKQRVRDMVRSESCLAAWPGWMGAGAWERRWAGRPRWQAAPARHKPASCCVPLLSSCVSS